MLARVPVTDNCIEKSNKQLPVCKLGVVVGSLERQVAVLRSAAACNRAQRAEAGRRCGRRAAAIPGPFGVALLREG